MHEAVVHEHVGEGLPPAELRAQGESHGKGVLHERGVNEGGDEHNYVHIQQVAGYNRDIFQRIGHLKSFFKVIGRDNRDNAPPGGGKFGIFTLQEGVYQALGLQGGA